MNSKSPSILKDDGCMENHDQQAKVMDLEKEID